MEKLPRIFLWTGIALILTIGIIHLVDAQDSFSDAIYKGWLFYANGLAAAIAAYGIYHKHDWAWNLGFIVAIGSFGGYVASRTIGLPFIPAEPENWFEPLGVISIIAEILLIGVFIAKRSRKI